MKKSLILFILLPFCNLTMEHFDYSFMNTSPNTYHGTAIGPESLLKLAELPDNKVELRGWIADHKKLLSEVIPYRTLPSHWLEQAEANREKMRSEGIKCLGKWNHVFRVGEYVFKVSGPFNRMAQIMAAHFKFGNEKTPSDSLEKVATYQTASNAATYLRFKEFKQEYDPQKIIMPETYVTCLADENGIEDDNAIVVQKWDPTPADLISKKPDVLEYVTPETFRTMIGATAYLGLWDIYGHLRVTEDGSFKLADLEQPNNEPASYFFHKNIEKYQGNVNCGLGELAELCFEAEDRSKLEILENEVNKMTLEEKENQLMNINRKTIVKQINPQLLFKRTFMKKTIFLLFIFSASKLSAMDYSFMKENVNTYHGIEISSESLAGLASLPEPLESTIQEWIANEKELITQIVPCDGSFSTVDEKVQADWDALKAAGIEKISRKNYTFHCPLDATLIIHISHSRHRMRQAKAEIGKYDEDVPRSEIEKVTSFQTASRASTSLRLQEYKERFPSSDLILPSNYVTKLNTEGGVDDDNALVVSIYDDTPAQLVRDNFDVLRKVSVKTLQQFLGAMVYAGLWDISSNLQVTDDGKIKFVDYEQPNNEPPHYFFHRNKEKFENNVICGVKQLADLYTGANMPNRLEIIRKEILKMPLSRDMLTEVINEIDQKSCCLKREI